ncbi:monosaccharide-P-dolichol utilization protein [Cladochytrium replicatum]|nr:monosaccharide-P-dolichol utilization protein [Cladochytrium replicatum]
MPDNYNDFYKNPFARAPKKSGDWENPLDILKAFPWKDLLAGAFGAIGVNEKCSNKLASLDFQETACVKLAASKGLGLGLVAGGLFLKVPQIINIVAANSGDGISLTAYFMETVSYMVSVAFDVREGNPFSTFGENVFITFQNVLIISLIFGFGGQIPHVFTSIIGFGILAAILSAVPANILLILRWSTLFVGLGSKIPQIYESYKAQSTGQLSGLTSALQLAGSTARIFTSLQEVKQPVILIGYIVGTVLNAAVMYQVAVYGGPKRVVSEKEKEKAEEKAAKSSAEKGKKGAASKARKAD